MTADDLINGEISRALTLAGFSFNTHRAEPEGQRPVRLFSMPFVGPEAPFIVSAYLASPFFVALAPLRLLHDESFARLSESVLNQVPMVRLIKDPFAQGDVGHPILWVEASSVVHAGSWGSEGHVLASVPVNAVVSAVRSLLANFRSDVELAVDVKVPLMDVSIAPTSRSSMPAAVDLSLAQPTASHVSVSVPTKVAG